MGNTDIICVAEAYWGAAVRHGATAREELEQAIRENPRNATLSPPVESVVTAPAEGPTKSLADVPVDSHTPSSTKGATDGHTEGPINGSTDSHTVDPPKGAGHIDGPIDGHAPSSIKAATDGHTEGPTNGSTDSHTVDPPKSPVHIDSPVKDSHNAPTDGLTKGSDDGHTDGSAKAPTEGSTEHTIDEPAKGHAHMPPGGVEDLAILTSMLWAPGRNLRVQFHGGSIWQHETVKHYASRWSERANISFTFGTTGNADILVSFDVRGGNWSLLGTRSRTRASKNEPSMNLASVYQGAPTELLQRKIIHEFGHALGAVHEHQSPLSTIRWNRQAVYKEFGGPPNNWTKAVIDHNILTAYDIGRVQATAFDPDSIMLYEYTGDLTLDGKGTKHNANLSARDLDYMAFCYPPASYDVRQFSTMEVHPDDAPQATSTKDKYFYEKYPAVPQLALGLTSLDISTDQNIRIRAEASQVTTEKFVAGLNCWADTRLYSASMSYLEVSRPRFSYVQTGSYNTTETRPGNKAQLLNTKRITFARPFSARPKVVVWLNALDMDRWHNWRIKVRATNVDTRGFTLHLDSWSDSLLYSAGATWLAYPADQPNVISGRFSTDEFRPWDRPRPDTAGSTVFAKSFRNEIPKVMVALDTLDYLCGKNLRVRLSLSSVSPRFMWWHLQSWSDSVMYSAGASYFAFL